MAKGKKASPDLIFEDFRLNQITFEPRYNFGESLQSKTREFLVAIQEKLPNPLELLERQNQTFIFNYNNKFEIPVSPDRFAIIQLYPDKTLKEFINLSKLFTEIALEILDIEKFVRIGLRTMFVRDCESATDITGLLYKSPYIQTPDNLYLAKKGIPLMPNLLVGWQTEEKGITYNLRGESGTLNLDIPLILSASGEYPPHIQKQYNHVIFDVDLFLNKPVLPGQFFAEDWIKGAFDTIYKEGNKFFGSKE